MLALRQPNVLAPLGILSLSVGVAIGNPAALASPDQRLELAGQALYRAKRDGRNCVQVLETAI